jgi:adenine deaminase
MALDPPTLLIKGGRVFSPFTGEMFAADVAICGSLIAGVGHYPGSAERVIDAQGAFVLPGFIDAHVHPETSLLSPPRFAEALAVHGITTTLSEPHEITNVMGRSGIDFYLRARSGLPLDLRIMIPTTAGLPLRTSRRPLEDRTWPISRRETVSRAWAKPWTTWASSPGEASGAVSSICPGTAWSTGRSRRHRTELAAYLLAGPITDHETRIQSCSSSAGA